MSREIKFRIWDKNEKCFPIEGEIYLFDAIKGYRKNLIPEQYTGLKDKNGEEIYEGDIVLDYYDGDDAFIVKWDKDTASFILTGTDNVASVSFDNFFPNKDLEIIGNIHENPELLGGKE